MSREPKPLSNYSVYKLVDGVWVFWMNARGKSAAQMAHAVWWRNKGKIPRSHIKAEPQ